MARRDPARLTLRARRLALGALLAALVASCGGTSQSPVLSVTDPRGGREVPVSCAAVSAEECLAAAEVMLDYLPMDAAKVEAVRVEPFGVADSTSGAALRVTLDHEMFAQSGEQPYRVVLGEGGADARIEPVFEGD